MTGVRAGGWKGLAQIRNEPFQGTSERTPPSGRSDVKVLFLFSTRVIPNGGRPQGGAYQVGVVKCCRHYAVGKQSSCV